MTTKKTDTSINLGKCSECKKDYNRSELGTCTMCNASLCPSCCCDCYEFSPALVAELAACQAA